MGAVVTYFCAFGALLSTEGGGEGGESIGILGPRVWGLGSGVWVWGLGSRLRPANPVLSGGPSFKSRFATRKHCRRARRLCVLDHYTLRGATTSIIVIRSIRSRVLENLFRLMLSPVIRSRADALECNLDGRACLAAERSRVRVAVRIEVFLWWYWSLATGSRCFYMGVCNSTKC